MKTVKINMIYVIDYPVGYAYMPLRSRIFWASARLETNFCDKVIIGHYLPRHDYKIAMRLTLFTHKLTSDLIWLNELLK